MPMISVSTPQNPDSWTEPMRFEFWQEEVKELEKRVSHLKLRLKHGKMGFCRRARIGAQMDACTARILALKLAHA